MLNINLICIGDRSPEWVRAGYQNYAKRVRAPIQLNLIEIANKRADNATAIARLHRAIPKDNHIIALDRGGKQMTSQNWSKAMKEWMQDGRAITLIIGAAEGLARDTLKIADEIWSLSGLTFAHQLTRIIVAEQIYRAYTIIQNHPYHR